MKNLAIAALVLGSVAAAGSASLAQAVSPRVACAPDMAKLCSAAQPGTPDMRQCMMSHRDQISDGCKSAIAAMMAQRRAQSSSPNH